jgi:hypothetical protein
LKPKISQSTYTESSKISKTDGQQFFSVFSLKNPNELLRDFQRTKNWDTGSGQEMIAFFTA